jgi:hypothetical protein
VTASSSFRGGRGGGGHASRGGQWQTVSSLALSPLRWCDSSASKVLVWKDRGCRAYERRVGLVIAVGPWVRGRLGGGVAFIADFGLGDRPDRDEPTAAEARPVSCITGRVVIKPRIENKNFRHILALGLLVSRSADVFFFQLISRLMLFLLRKKNILL